MSSAEEEIVSAAVLIGGRSRRMKQDKILVPLAGKPIIEYVLDRLSGIFSQIVLIGYKRAGLKKYGKIYEDIIPSSGPLSGIYTALKILNKPVFVCAGDMPFLNGALLRFQIKQCKNFDVVVPSPDGFYEPLHSIYSLNCLPAIERLIKSGRKKPVEFFKDVRIREITDPEINRFDPSGLSFFNINTISDLKKAEKILKKMRVP